MTDPATKSDTLRRHARAIWDAAVAAARPDDLVARALADPHGSLHAALKRARRILVVGAGKAGAAMAQGVEQALAPRLPDVDGWVNVPAGCEHSLARIHLHPARPAGSNHPTAAGVEGTRRILDLLAHAGPDDVALCLLSGGGSALLPAPADGLTLEDKQAVTRLLHASGATINEMNCVRKHASASKGGRLAQAFTGRALYSLLISDVIGDPLDVIASGPTAADPTTYADALAVLDRYGLTSQSPLALVTHLHEGAAGRRPETLKLLPAHVHNLVLSNNALALAAATRAAEKLGYRVVNLGSHIEGETRPVAVALAGLVRSVRADRQPAPAPVCLLSGGETTVTLPEDHGQGGRNQEFVLAAALHLGEDNLRDVVVLSGGTDGEDGPTDAAGALADGATLRAAARLRLDPAAALARHDAYPFFDAVGDLLRTGLTGTNVLDVRVMLIGRSNAWA